MIKVKGANRIEIWKLLEETLEGIFTLLFKNIVLVVSSVGSWAAVSI